MTILSSSDCKEFESIPEFNNYDRKKYFFISVQLQEILNTIQIPQNKIYFILMVGYFKCTNKFYTKDFNKKDVKYLCKKLSINIYDMQHGKNYDQMVSHYKKLIVKHLGYNHYSKSAEQLLKTDVSIMVRAQTRPKLMFIHCVELLRYHKFEIPSHHVLCKLIIREINLHKRELVHSVSEQVTDKISNSLDSLVNNYKVSNTEYYSLTMLKKFYQSTKPQKIKANITDLKKLQDIYVQVEPIYTTLNLNAEGLRYYASFVLKSRVSQIKQKHDKDRYLYLIAFVIHQYFVLQDTLVKILHQTVKNSINTAIRKHKDKCYANRKDNIGKLKKIVSYTQKSFSKLQVIKQIIENINVPDSEKVKQIKSTIYSNQDAQQELVTLTPDVTDIKNESSYYDILEEQSIKLQHRVSDIIKNLEFCRITSSKSLLSAIDYYREKEANIDYRAPINFLDYDEQQHIYDEQKKFRVSLYKILLFRKISDSLRSGELNIRHSYMNKSLDDYIIPKSTWEVNKNEYIKNAKLEDFVDCNSTLNNLETTLNNQYHLTNQNIITKKNSLINFNKDGEFSLKTPKPVKDAFSSLSEYFPVNNYISLSEVLYTVNKEANFMEAFDHWQQKYQRKKKPTSSILAGIVGLGCDIGEHKIAKISRSINESELYNTISWYFDSDNINNANNKIIQLAIKSGIPELYLNSDEPHHTSSDGYKKNVAGECIDADYSFKYAGNKKAMSVYGFIDSRHLLFSSTVISSAEREAAYVIDGLMHNEVVKSDIHSTDTHGYSELVFCTTHLLGISFAPRIKNLKKQQIYSFEKRKYYEELGYKILPKKYINKELIVKYWDDILRFITTIKLRETTASQLFKRLNSYSKQNKLYQALKEFGKIMKSIFILKYIDNLELRQVIEKQLNKVESSNKFARAISFGNNQTFKQDTKEGQVIAEGCSRIIKNAIICWNYLYLRKQIANENNCQKRQELLNSIRNGSVITWQHINLHGEYDFSEDKLHDSIGLSLAQNPKLLAA